MIDFLLKDLEYLTILPEILRIDGVEAKPIILLLDRIHTIVIPTLVEDLNDRFFGQYHTLMMVDLDVLDLDSLQ